MDSELRRRFLQLLGFDLAKEEMRGLLRFSTLSGPDGWARVREWWLSDDRTPISRPAEPSQGAAALLLPREQRPAGQEDSG